MRIDIKYDINALAYTRMTDGYAVVLMKNGDDSIFNSSANADDVELKYARGKPLCVTHIWKTCNGGIKNSVLDRPYAYHGISTLYTIAERKTAYRLRRTIFRKDSIVSGNVVFTSEVYNRYVSLRNISGKNHCRNDTSFPSWHMLYQSSESLLGQKTLGRGRECFPIQIESL